MKRRAFFASIAALTAGAALDPERLLWIPGRKLISIPRAEDGVWMYDPTEPGPIAFQVAKSFFDPVVMESLVQKWWSFTPQTRARLDREIVARTFKFNRDYPNPYPMPFPLLPDASG